ncbi:PREDICTED: neuronal acetylcholine receptor subunit beta-4 [Rhagoletis zephyria]|uniref:neuronal acetylcholine receptor subunit beta-4 n=1 Tax=Rhagoletis zephyria TaxID=28612 RepID=UPI0008112CCE|nr:PREDICTED: neuronal acetylcholine receptor subunit beta-4 [Rhagoletis zephyria]
MNSLSFSSSLGLVISVVTVIFVHYAAANKYNVSLGQMDTCKELTLRNTGYAYIHFFHIQHMNNNKVAANESLHLKFYVLAAMDAHILLATNDKPRSRDHVYEVVIGAGQNSFSAIRSRMGSQRVSTSTEAQILSIYDPTPIEIIQTKDGTLSVYITGYKKEPLLNYTDPAPLEINYLSFSSFGGASAKWFYDCQFDGFAEEMEESVHVLDPFHSLLANLTKASANESVPTALKSVDFAFQLKSVAYNHEKSILQTRLQLTLYWHDPRLAWNAEENGIPAVCFSSRNAPAGIWQPDLILLNAAHNIDDTQHEPDVGLVVYANGNLTMLNTNAEFTTWCVDTKRNWPHERLNCGLILGLKSFSPLTHEPITLAYDSSLPLPVEPFNMLSEWHFRQISLSVIATADNNTDRYGTQAIAQTMNGDISLEFVIERNGSFYKNVFMMPLVASETLIVLSFLLRGYRRGGLILAVFFVISLGMMFVTKHAPTAYIPNMLHAYRHVMRTATFCYLLHVSLMWLELYPPKAKPMDWMMRLINLSALRLLLCLRVTDCDEFVRIQTHPWRELAKMINNCCFIVISTLFIVIDILLLPSF